jgi:hypothetical protein
MSKLDQTGSHLLVVIIAVVVIGIIGFAGYKVSSKSEDTVTPSSSVSSSSDELVLQNLGVDLDNVLITRDALREYSTHGLKGFYPFGDKLGGTDDTRLNPNFEFSSLKPDTKIVSAIDGIVTFIREQTDTNDKEVFIQTKENSIWMIGYDHLNNVTVSKGDTVKAGDIIGEPAKQNNGFTRFEIQINKEDGGTTHVCPSTLLAPSVKDSILAGLKTMQESWETTSGFDLYDLTAQNPIGCIATTTLTPAQAEGR